MAYRVYTAELAQLSPPVIIIVTSWQTPDKVLHAPDLSFEKATSSFFCRKAIKSSLSITAFR
jgi:hypothetical protein